MGAANPHGSRRNSVGEISEPQRLIDEISARPAAQRAVGLNDKHKFKTEMDDEARRAMFGHLTAKVA